MIIEAQISGDDRVVAMFGAFTPALEKEIRASMTKLVGMLQQTIKFSKLSGQVLNVRSGRLRKSISTSVEQTRGRTTGNTFTDVWYGRVHEYGFTGVIAVEAHLRQIKQAWGRSISPKSVFINAYERRVNLPERSFMRTALRDLHNSGAISAEFNDAVVRAMK